MNLIGHSQERFYGRVGGKGEGTGSKMFASLPNFRGLFDDEGISTFISYSRIIFPSQVSLNNAGHSLKKLVNASLLSGSFPSSQRHALVTPVLKKPHLDPSVPVPNNYKPISNLSFVSKLLERVVVRQLTAHLESNGLIPAPQSAYRRNHSTETALLKICNDALMAADNGMVTLAVLLDYSAAFDTVDHSTMLDLLERRCGLTDDALRWHTS